MTGQVYITLNHANSPKQTEYSEIITETNSPAHALERALTVKVEWSSLMFTLVKDKD